MESSQIKALIPIMNGPAQGCMVVYDDGRHCRRFCSVERYMNTMAAFMGNDNRACRKLFHRRRGTGVLLNDGTIFVQIRLARNPPDPGLRSHRRHRKLLHRRQRKMRPPPFRR